MPTAARNCAQAAVDKDQQLVIFSLQLNRFKAINDRHGYDVGDEMLRMIAASLEQLAGPGDLVARLAGDEFAIALASPRERGAGGRATG